MLLTKHKLEYSKKHFFAFIPAIIWAGIIAFMSLLPSTELPSDLLLFSDKLIHAFIYFSLTLFIFLAFIHQAKLLNTRMIFINVFNISALISLLFGILIELAQDKMDIGRTGDWKDVIANSFGIIIVYPSMKLFLKFNISKKLFVNK